MNRRRSHRLSTNMPVEYRVVLPEVESQFSGLATLKNISERGAYFECDSRPCFIPSQVCHFTLKSIGGSEELGSLYLAAKVIVRRIDLAENEKVNFGLAIEFLSVPSVYLDNRGAVRQPLRPQGGFLHSCEETNLRARHGWKTNPPETRSTLTDYLKTIERPFR